MLDLTKKAPQGSIEVCGRTYRIKTWFKYWLRFAKIISSKDEVKDFDFLFMDDIPEDKEAAMKELMLFAYPKRVLPRPVGPELSVRTIDYEIDSDYIYAAFMQCYSIDLMSGILPDGTELHWHKFLALANGLSNTKLNTIMEARVYDESDRTSYDESRKQSREAWALEGLAEEDSQALEDFNKEFS